LIGVNFVSLVCAKATVGHAKAQAAISIVALSIGKFPRANLDAR
jgi:hypothetical protein